MNESLELNSRYGMHTEEFSDLMRHRVGRILMVASQYDAFALEEDGQLSEQLFREYRNLDLNPRYTPRFTHVGSAKAALERLAEREFDLIITTPRIGDMDVETFGKIVKSKFEHIPLTVLAAHAWDLPRLADFRKRGVADWVFLWQGDAAVLLAILKQVEDRANVDADVRQGIQVIILVEDGIRFFSSYLPQIYTEITLQTGRLVAESLNISHRLLRIRARPKILLAQTFEEAWELYEHFKQNILGVISDVRFSLDGKEDPEAGLNLLKRIREQDADLPILMQSSELKNRQLAHDAGASFIWKNSPHLLEDIRDYILNYFGFGDFVFRMPDGKEVGRAKTMKEMVDILERAPSESIEYHAQRNHFSMWLKARSEFELAALLKPRRVTEFSSIDEIRSHLRSSIASYLREVQRHVITDFDEETYDGNVSFAKVGEGSLGGKGRGLAFMHKLLSQERIQLPGVEVSIPETTVLASDVFEEFLEDNELLPIVLGSEPRSDADILNAFRRGRFNHRRRGQLATILTHAQGPFAVRSSSILEDSLYQPFAGVYATVMLPNSHASLDVRLAQLLEAVKVVYASTYLRAAREYLDTTPHRIEEERMAVLIQRLVGSARGGWFYPTIAGVASSWNFYPAKGVRPDEGVVQIALGLGKTVVDGYDALRFCPAHPEILPQFSSTKDMLRNAQRRFYGLDMSQESVIPGLDYDANLLQLDVSEAVKDGAVDQIGSTYVPDSDRVVGGIIKGGTPLVTFAGLLQGYVLPLPEVLQRLLRICQDGFGMPVEIEFAMNLEPGSGHRQVFNVLQVRPLVVEKMETIVDLESLAGSAIPVVVSERALGHGRVLETRDLVVVDPRRLDRSLTGKVAEQIEKLNAQIRSEGRSYILLGPGRWGSNDSWLGIPVVWHQISSAGAIIETDFKDFEVEPSQGSHFFHNITTFGVAYLTVHESREPGAIKWEFIDALPRHGEYLDGVVLHIRLDQPLKVFVDGHSGKGIVIADAG